MNDFFVHYFQMHDKGKGIKIPDEDNPHRVGVCGSFGGSFTLLVGVLKRKPSKTPFFVESFGEFFGEFLKNKVYLSAKQPKTFFQKNSYSL